MSLLTGEPYGPRIRLVSEKAEEESSDDEPESEDEEEARYQKDYPEVPSEFWHIQKLIKYMKAGNQTATMVALCLLKDYDLTDRVRVSIMRFIILYIRLQEKNCQLFITIIQLLYNEMNNFIHIHYSLFIILSLSLKQIIQKAIQEMGGLEVLVNLLETNDIKCQNGSLSVLLQIATSTEMKRYLIDLDITTPLIRMLKHPARDIQVVH